MKATTIKKLVIVSLFVILIGMLVYFYCGNQEQRIADTAITGPVSSQWISEYNYWAFIAQIAAIVTAVGAVMLVYAVMKWR